MQKIVIFLICLPLMILSLPMFASLPSLYSQDYAPGLAYGAEQPEKPVHGVVREHIRERMKEGSSLRNQSLNAWPLVELFYRNRNYDPAWSRNAMPSPGVRDMASAIEEVHLEGLTSGYYHIESIMELLEEVRRQSETGNPPDAEDLADLDLFLSDAFLVMGCDFSAGCANPAVLKAKWFTERGEIDVVAKLEKALRENRVKEELKSMLPSQAGYSRLRRALMIYREIQAKGGWLAVPDGPLLRKGDAGRRIEDLRRRLVASGDMYLEEKEKDTFFDQALEKAVKRFQKRHGLRADGVVGPATLKELNVPVEERISSLRVNLERLRWLLGNLGQRYVIVNIADFRLDVMENGRSVMSMKVVVGKPFWHTPIFSAKMTYLVLNPSWNVPQSIAIKEVLPKIRKNRGYLADEKMKVIKGWGPREEILDPAKIDWTSVNAKNFPFRLRQDPGPLNPLGVIKFMFPNKYNVYLHDSPAKSLFDRDVRIFSHGCIRIEKPLDLALYLLKDDPSWSEELLLTEIENGEEQNVRITVPLYVHVVYLTSWVDEEGAIQFRNDIYGRDSELSDILSMRGAGQ